MIKIVFPEYNNKIIQEAISRASEIMPVEAKNLEEACLKLRTQEVDAMIAGIDYTSREVILACRSDVGVVSETFSASFLMSRGEEKYVIADAAACKDPTEDQLFDIVCQTYQTAKAVLSKQPKVAMLSFSTLGSGGKDESITKIQNVISRIRMERPEIMIDGEMQLDAAINGRIGQKKAPKSEVAGQANVLICPDLNSGNILYKAMEQFGGFVAAGPILQGFKKPASDLSRGSTVKDILLVIDVMKKIVKSSGR